MWTLFDAELWGRAAKHRGQAEAAGEVVEEKLFPLLSLPPPAYLTLQLHMKYTALRHKTDGLLPPLNMYLAVGWEDELFRIALAEAEYSHPRPARQEHQEAQQAEQVRAGAALHEAVRPADG